MGLLITGILIGWLAEWIFYTFWVKKDTDETSVTNSSDCSAQEAELITKANEIAALKVALEKSQVENVSKEKSKPSKIAVQSVAAVSTPTKDTEAKEETSKNVASKNKAALESKKTVSSKGDDLTKIEGVGPKAAGALANAGLATFLEVSKASEADIQKILDESEGRFGMMKPGTWPKQAQLASDEKWDELKKWQDEMNGGIE